MATPVFLDANVFLYAAGADHPEKAACVALLRRVADGAVAAATSVEVVQELIYVLSRRGRPADALKLATRTIALFPALLPVTRDDMTDACALVEQHPDLPPRDAVHAATMRNNGLHAIVTADPHFDAIPGVRRLGPSQVG